MFIEESGGTDLTVTVEGEEYTAEATVDLDEDGIDDTVVVETDDGAIAFTDTDSDGEADLMTRIDSDGDIVGQARYDESSGDWVHVEPGGGGRDDDGDDEQAAGGDSDSMVIETPNGPVDAGPATHDTDGDGVNDSVVVTDSDGDTLIFTDADEDGDADFATEITGDGQVTVSEHLGDGEWNVIERGHLDEDGQYQRDSIKAEADALVDESGWTSSNGGSETAEVRVDPRTGDWVRG